MYPNPSEGRFTFEWSIDVEGQYSLEIYNIIGQEVKSIINSRMDVAIYKYNVGLLFASGVYFAKLINHNSNRSIIIKFIIIR